MGVNQAIRRAAVLGAGVMGAQIAAHLINAGVETLLYELPAEGKDPDANARAAIAKLAKMAPAPMASNADLHLIEAANYETGLERLRGCDLVIEAIAERPDLKEALYAKVAPMLEADAILASNTSGLSINLLAGTLPEGMHRRFCGVHFFNPPRYMKLVELIPCKETEPQVLDRLETFLVSEVGKGVIRAKDTPNFIGNRIGVFSMLAVMHHAEVLGIPFETVDALTGTAIGRPKSATFRTADVVGLDTMAHVVNGSAQVLKDDPWHKYYHLPDWLDGLIEKGALGQKTRVGIYKKSGREILVFDPAAGDYRPSAPQVADEVQAMLAIRDVGERFAALRASDHPQARLLWACHRDVFHYAACLLAEIADNARDLDQALRWGFGWRQGPFETWEQIGWKRVNDWLREEIANGQTMAAVELPAWTGTITSVHCERGSYAACDDSFRPRSSLAVYRRQRVPETLYGEPAPDLGETVYENDGVRLWRRDDDIAILGFKSKQHVVGEEVLVGLTEAIEIAGHDYRAMVIWQDRPPFSLGANLQQFLPIMQSGDAGRIDQAVGNFQQACLAMRDADIPVVAAVNGMALGGGCELLMHCDRVVASLESYIGLVEIGVGLLPAGGGSKELARRAALHAGDGDILASLKTGFEAVAMAKVATSAVQARELGFLRPADVIILNPDELLHVAISQARALAESVYRPPLKRPIRVAGRDGAATLKAVVVNMQAGGFISEYDASLAGHIAEVLCGGDVAPGTEVSEAWMLKLERQAFVALAQNPLTHARIEHMLKTGKPLRN